MKVLITGFEPFGGEKINPAWESVKKLEDRIENAEIVKVQIPTVFGKSIDKLLEAIDEEKPDIVLCIGQAGGRCNITVERVAINIDDAGIADNEGNTPIDEGIFIDGANAYFANVPVKSMVKEMRNNNIPASLSNTAGTFVCNHIMYGLLYYIDKQYNNIRGGFIHVPYIPEQVIDKPNIPSMSLNDIVRGLNLAIKAVVNNEGDIKESEGKIM